MVTDNSVPAETTTLNRTARPLCATAENADPE
jgi:hypothetical protein